ncbi:MAG: glucose-6-phosphate isomerase [Gemmatimonadetes bacterium]|nr:glucose-6-phosphate isomerase [Gemmatimonadota bacterium]
MPDRILLDYNNMVSPRLGGRGLDPARLAAAAARFRAIQAAVERQRAAGGIAFLQLPYETELVERIRAFADGLGQAFDTVVVLGIGGSALGTSALAQALLPPFWNERDAEARDYYPRLYVLDNIDPTTIGPFLDRLDLARTLFNVVSKSGATAETMAQFLIVRERLRRAFEEGDRGHLIFTTDPEKGVLRDLARAENIASLPIPPGVGGRFSVLSAVGLLPAALVGIPIERLLRGAREMDERCRSDVLEENPAGLFATLQYLAHLEAGASIHVLMPYSDRLYGIADWFRQLWAESLGKRLDRAGREVFRGPTPVKALGATDQHSQVQLYMEGPFDKTVTLLVPAEVPEDVAVPDLYPGTAAFGYLGGHTLAELLRTEAKATATALARHGRMNLTLELPALGPEAIGGLLMLFQIATVYAGEWYDVNAFDQPGVELGKELTGALLRRPGTEVPALDPPDRRWICE